MVFSKNMKVNKNIALGILVLLGVGNLTQMMNLGNLFSAIPFGTLLLPFVASIGLLWVAYGLWKGKIR